MKKLLLPLLLTVLFVGTGCGPKPTEGAAAAADQFARTLIAQDYGGAYRDASMSLRTSTRFDDFNFRASRLKAAPKSAVQWDEPVEKDGAVMITGVVPRVEGAPGKIAVTLMREIDEWKVLKFEVE